MPNREYEPVRREDGNQGFRGRDERDERELGMRDERWGQGQGWQGRNQERGGWGSEERWSPERYGRSWDERMRNLSGMGGYGRSGGMERGYGPQGDERWGRGYGDERWGRSGEERWGRGYYGPHSEERWGRGYDDMRQHPFGFGGMDRGFGGGGYGGYGGYGGREPYSGGGGYWAREGMHPGPYGNQELGWEWRGYGRDFRGGPPWEPGRMQGRAPRSYVRSDDRIKEDLCDRLMQSWIDAENVDVQVTRGEVTLTGTVEHRAAKRAIEDLAEQILGVKDVQNQIRVQERHDERSGSSTPSGTTTARKPSA